jgi:hypothetical protein
LFNFIEADAMPLPLDHIVIAVTDLDQAIRDYEVLGFTVLPGGEHPRGSRNALVVFADGSYLEIIAFPKPQPDFRWWQVLQSAGSGLVDYALLPDAIEQVIARAQAKGLDIEGPEDGARLRPDGEQLAWKTARSLRSDVPFLCGDVTPRRLRVPEGEVRKHRNGVTGVAGLTIAVRHLAVSVGRYRALLGSDPLERGALPGLGVETVQFDLGSQIVSLAAPRSGAAADLDSHLAARGEGPFAVSFFGVESAVLDPILAHGARFEIVRAA